MFCESLEIHSGFYCISNLWIHLTFFFSRFFFVIASSYSSHCLPLALMLSLLRITLSFHFAMRTIESSSFLDFFSSVLRDSTTRFVDPSVRPSIRHTLHFFVFFGLWPHRSCPSDKVTSNTAPAHPHATGVAVYPALFPTNVGFLGK